MALSKVTFIPAKKKYDGAIRTAIYCRVSSHKKAQIESLTTQISALTTKIAYLPTHVLFDTYIDIASGSTLKGRPGFQRLLDDCKNGKIQFVVTKSASRFSRDVEVAITAIHQLTLCGVTVLFESEGITSDNPDLQVHLAAHLAVAEMENHERSENIKWGIKTGSELGTSKIYNKVCYGYKHDKQGNLIINDEEADNVRLIFRYYLDGHSILSIIKWLKIMHINSPSGKEKWNKRSIEKILNNIKYTGDAIVNTDDNRYVYSNHHPAIISREVFDAVQMQQKLRSNIIENPDGTITRKSTKYSSKRVTRETVDTDELISDLGLEIED